MSSNAAAESSSSLLRYLKRDLAAVREEAKSKNGVKVSDASQHLSSFCRYIGLKRFYKTTLVVTHMG